MRPIKFRVWDGYKMHYPEIVHFDRESVSFSPSESGGGLVKYPLASVEQFTGLLDKNGREIYDGDVCKYGDVLFMDGCFRIRDIPYSIGWNENITIIGNIHEQEDVCDR